MGTETIPESEALGVESPTDLEKKIIRQIEYYFGNYNLSRDKFLKEEIKVDEGWIPLEKMVRFNRLKRLTEDFSVIIKALKKSPRQLMEINEDSQKIRRRVTSPVPADYRERQSELDEKTLYVKGFKRNNTLDELLEFFKEYNVEHVFMRRLMHQNNKPFKGSVFVTFEEKADAENFLNSKGIKYKGTELLKEWKKDYMKRKDELFESLRAEKEKKALKKAGLLKEKENDEKVREIEFVPGCLLKLENLDENTTREHIKEAFEPHGTLVYVDYSKGNPSAVIRFESDVANSVLANLKEEDNVKKIEIGSCKSVVSAIEGDEEKEYWKNIAKSRAQNRLKFNKNKYPGNKGRFKKWGKRQKGKEDVDDKEDESAEPSAKKIKLEASEIKDECDESSSKTKPEKVLDTEVNSKPQQMETETVKVEIKTES